MIQTDTNLGRVEEEWIEARKFSKGLADNLDEKFQEQTEIKIVVWKRLNYQEDAHYECIEVSKMPYQKIVKKKVVRSSINNMSFGSSTHWQLE